MIKNLLHKTPLQKKIIAIFGVLFIAISIFTARLYTEIKDLQTSSKWLTHTYDVIAEARHLIKLMVDQETGLRGYLIVGKESFLEPFYSGQTQFNTK